MKAAVILNPYAGRGRALRALPQVERALAASRIAHTLEVSQGPGHAIELARAALADSADLIIAAGGDGTIGEVLNGMRVPGEPQLRSPLAVFPLGTANDLVTNLELPTDVHRVLECVQSNRRTRVDVGEVNGWLFANNSAIGLEPVVTLYNIRMTRLKGILRYLVAALRAIANARQWTVELEWESGTYRGAISLVSVGNCPVTGGLFRMAPAADPRDGRLTFVHAFAPSRLQMLRLLPRAIDGTYVNDPAAHQFHSSWLKIQTNPGTPLQVDGEIRGLDLNELDYRVHPLRLELFCE